MTDIPDVVPAETKPLKLAKAEFVSLTGMGSGGQYPYTYEDVDKMEVYGLKHYRETVEACRYFYKKDAIGGTIINKMIDIGINNLLFDKGSLSDNEFRIFTGLSERLLDFAETCALEYLLSGLIVPEVSYEPLPKDVIKSFGIKKYEAITAPTSMWVRDSRSIKINSSFMSSEPSYFIEVSDDLVFFIMHEGMYPDGTMDTDAYLEILTLYPDFVALVRAGKKEIKLDNPLIIRRRPLSDSAYPVPYLYPALESLKHKRNLRRMDYSIAARVITAIQQIKMGDKDFPLTEDDQEQVEHLKNQMKWRDGTNVNVERVFQLFTNHTVEIKWIFPDVVALLDEGKYINVNQDIFLALGFPKILTTGETERSGSSDPEFATISPVKTMEGMRKNILKIIKAIVYETAKLNNFKGLPVVSFENMNLHSFRDFVAGMTMLYDTKNISRTSVSAAFGYKWEEEVKQMAEEKKVMDELGIDEFAAKPYSPAPGENQQQQNKPKPAKEKPVVEESAK
jgi:hypothetical protein